MKPTTFLSIGLAALTLACAAPGRAQVTRDPYLWPFTPGSIWNQPIGSNAQYVNASLGPIGAIIGDDEFFVRENSSYPYHAIINPSTGASYVSVYVPDGFNTNIWRSGYSPNDATTFLAIDGFNFVQIQPCRRDSGTSDLSGYNWSGSNGTYTSLYDQGIGGSHFGSDLSAIGGSIRQGEMIGSAPIRHALKLELDWAQLYRNSSATDNNQETYTWPADRSDAGSVGEQGIGSYTGTNPALRIGSLLALDPSLTESSLGLKTVPAKKLFHAFQDYGAYVVDTAGNNYHINSGYACNICVQKEARTDFESTYGYGLDDYGGSDWYNDMNAIYSALKVVSNNASNNIGGGGTPRQSLAPPFAYGGAVVGVYQPIPGTIEAENYDVGGEGVAYHDTDTPNNGGAYRNDGVDVEACSEGGYDVGWTAAGEYLKYGVNVATAGTYTVGFRVAAIASGNAFHLENSTGTNLSGTVTCPNTGGWQTWQTVNATVTLPAGSQTLKLVEDTGGYNINYMAFTASASSSITLAGSAGAGQASLSWTPYSGAASYRVKISTTSGSGYSWVVTGWGSTSFTDTGLTNGTTYYFVVAALDGSGNELANSNQVAVTPASAGTTTDIAAGGGAVGSFVADKDYSGGSTYNTSDTINTSAANSAPAGVYQNERYGTFSYTVPVTAPPSGGSYTVRLHFAELYHGISGRGNDGGTGQRLFNVSINGASVLSNFDIYATAGAADTAVVETFTGYQPNSSGNLVISFAPASGSPDQNAKVDGIEVFDPSGGKVAPAAPTGVKAVVRKGQVALSWAGVSGATSYTVLRGTATGKEAAYKSGVTGSWFGDTSVTSGTTYYYKVVSVNAKGQSAASAEVKATAQ